MTTLDLTFLRDRINHSVLDATLRALYPDALAGTSIEDGVGVRVHIVREWWDTLDDAQRQDVRDTLQQALTAHNPDALTAEQAAQAQAATAPDRVRAVPGWALWDEAQAVDWISANVTDLASAKVALTAMARMLVALRDAQWPTLRID